MEEENEKQELSVKQLIKRNMGKIQNCPRENTRIGNNMPVKYGKDKKGKYAKWGNSGKKYYGKGRVARAKRQGRAIKSKK